jgi:hypothetical protein
MIIHEPRMREVGEEVVVEAAVDLGGAGGRGPGSLWFALPRRLAGAVDRRADGFAAALLPLAMNAGEPLEVRGELSLRLAAGMREYQRIQCAWKPDFFRPVELRAERLVARNPAATAGKVASSFSGGVDSFFTVMRHLPDREQFAPYRLDCCLMINGFDEDASVDDPAGFAPIPRVYEAMMAGLGLDLVVVRTNLLRLLGPIVRAQCFAAFLTAPALLLGRHLARFYIPSSCKVTTMGLFPDGSHLMLDHVLSSESLDVVHDGPEVSRVEKTVALSEWPETFGRLRVCHRRVEVRDGGAGIGNCCTCEKCVRTMVTLEAAGALGRYASFPRPLERRRTRRADLRTAASRLFAEEVIEFAARQGRRDLVRDLRRAVIRCVLFRVPVTAVFLASRRLEYRSRAWARLVAAPKRLLKRRSLGRGWLY